MTYLYHYMSPLGGITLTSDGEAVTGLWFDGQKYFPAGLSETHPKDALPVFEEAARWLNDYFAGKAPSNTPPLKLEGTSFRRAVWEILLTIPYGQTITYGEVAHRLAEQEGFIRTSAQAVGNAVGHNPISLMVPCHRVVGTNGSLTGYAGGIDKKLWLLRLEGADTSGFFMPKKGTAL